MGVGLGFAIAAQLYCHNYHPKKRVICVEGDSAFGFSGMEIETMFRFVPIIHNFITLRIRLFYPSRL